MSFHPWHLIKENYLSTVSTAIKQLGKLLECGAPAIGNRVVLARKLVQSIFEI